MKKRESKWPMILGICLPILMTISMLLFTHYNFKYDIKIKTLINQNNWVKIVKIISK